jgi:hypothetical protein
MVRETQEKIFNTSRNPQIFRKNFMGQRRITDKKREDLVFKIRLYKKKSQRHSCILYLFYELIYLISGKVTG